MDKKKYLLIILAILALLAASFFGYKYFFSGSAKKIEIQNEVAENDLQRGSTSLDQNDQKRSNLSEENSEVVQEEVKNNSSEKNETNEITPTEKNIPTEKTNITNKFVSWGYEKAAARKIDTIIIHSTYNALGGDQFSLSKILDIYKSYGVASHYIIDRGGKIYRLVADENIAYHAGESKMPDGRTGVNNFSIGIELINTKENEFTDEQYEALSKLIKDIKSRYNIKYVLGHNQIAPGRKDDPWNFDWGKI
jgi:hypothetical protein